MSRPLRVYLAGPINGCTDDEAKDWRARARELLESIGMEVLDPMARDYRGREDEDVAQIVDGDLADIARCDILFVNAARPSWGTAMEVAIAARVLRKHVVAVVPPGTPVSPWLRAHAEIVLDFPSAVDVAKKKR